MKRQTERYRIETETQKSHLPWQGLSSHYTDWGRSPDEVSRQQVEFRKGCIRARMVTVPCLLIQRASLGLFQGSWFPQTRFPRMPSKVQKSSR